MASVHTRTSTTFNPSNLVPGKPTNTPLYRRLLLPNLSPSTPPPPLLVSASTEVNDELYDFLALALRAYITPWWSKITRYDREFIPQVAAVLAELIRSLEVRIVTADIPQLLLRVLPILLVQHYADYRIAAAKVGSSFASGGGMSIPQLFHNMQPHVAVDADGQIDPEYFRRTFDHILAKTLPSEDNESDVEQLIVREVIVKVLLQDVVPQLVQPWFIHRLMLGLLDSGSNDATVKMPGVTSYSSQSQGLSVLIVFSLSAIQYLSGLCLYMIDGYKKMRNTIRLVNISPNPVGNDQRDYASCMVLAIAEVASMRERSASSAILLLMQFTASAFCNFLNKFLTYVLLNVVLTEQQILATIKLAKNTLFPNGYPGPPPLIPSEEEQVIMKEQLLRRIENRIPPWVGSAVLGPGAHHRQTIREALSPISSAQCNAHLVLFLFDAIVAALFLELAVVVGDEADSGKTTTSVVTRDGSLQSARESLDDRDEEVVSPLPSPDLVSV